MVELISNILPDIRPHPFFPTLQFRICDMSATFDEMLALCQALVAKLS